MVEIASIADDVWQHIGEHSVYVEPFVTDLCALLANQNPPKREVASDTSGFISNFWRCGTETFYERVNSFDRDLDAIAIAREHLDTDRLRFDPWYHDDTATVAWLNAVLPSPIEETDIWWLEQRLANVITVDRGWSGFTSDTVLMNVRTTKDSHNSVILFDPRFSDFADDDTSIADSRLWAIDNGLINMIVYVNPNEPMPNDWEISYVGDDIIYYSPLCRKIEKSNILL